jgi:hypothetical protein
MVREKKKGMKKGMKKMKGGFLPQAIATIEGIHTLGKTYKPATKLTGVLNSFGVETDPNKIQNPIGKAGAYLLSGARDILGWGPVVPVVPVNAQVYGRNQGLNQVMSGRGKSGGRKYKVIKI